jgi:hypothetical protein
VPVLAEYLELWDLLTEVALQPNVADTHIWRFAASGQYSAKSAYEAMFTVAIHFKPWEGIWKSWAPSKCKFFLWLVAHNQMLDGGSARKKGFATSGVLPLM